MDEFHPSWREDTAWELVRLLGLAAVGLQAGLGRPDARIPSGESGGSFARRHLELFIEESKRTELMVEERLMDLVRAALQFTVSDRPELALSRLSEGRGCFQIDAEGLSWDLGA
jgi:hypothetical protein